MPPLPLAKESLHFKRILHNCDYVRNVSDFMGNCLQPWASFTLQLNYIALICLHHQSFVQEYRQDLRQRCKAMFLDLCTKFHLL